MYTQAKIHGQVAKFQPLAFSLNWFCTTKFCLSLSGQNMIQELWKKTDLIWEILVYYETKSCHLTLPYLIQHNVINYLLIIANMYTLLSKFHLTKMSLPKYHFCELTKLSSPNCHCQIVITQLSYLNRYYLIVITKLSLPNCHYQTAVSILSLPNCHYQIVITKLTFPNCHYQTVITKLTLPNCHYQIDITKKSVHLSLPWGYMQ